MVLAMTDIKHSQVVNQAISDANFLRMLEASNGGELQPCRTFH